MLKCKFILIWHQLDLDSQKLNRQPDIEETLREPQKLSVVKNDKDFDYV